ncbi:hypothetical protein SLA2020_383770 [Shorea laevis]
MSLEASDLGGRVEAGLFEKSQQKVASTDPISSSVGNDLGLQHKPILVATCQARENDKRVGRQIGADQPMESNKIMENESRIEHKSESQNEHQQQRKEKEGESLGNNSDFWADLQSEEGSEKGWMATSDKASKKRKKKRAKSCRAVYQKASLQRLLMQREKNRGVVKEKKARRDDIPKFQPGMNKAVAGGSLGDSGIQNRNRLLKEHPSRRIAEELWEFARKIGVAAENEEQVINKLEEMERRDRRAKEADCSKDVKKKQKVSELDL